MKNKTIGSPRRLASLILIAALAGVTAISANAQQRGIAAGGLVLDDYHGHTLIYQTPESGDPGYSTWTSGGPLYLRLPIPPTSGAAMGFIFPGPPSSGPAQMLVWDPPTSAGGTGGIQGAWRPELVSDVLGTSSGDLSGSGTDGHLAAFTGPTSLGNTDLTGDVTTSGGEVTTIVNVPVGALPANVTLQGNTFNGTSELVKLDGTGKLPALNGSALTSLTGANVVGNISGAAGSLSPGADINGMPFTGASNITITAAPSGNAGGDLASTYPNPTIATTAGGHIVTAINDGAGIISNANLTGSGEITVTGGTGLGVSGSPVALGGTVTLSNTGVTSDVAGSGISVNNGGVGAVTITNTGVLGVTAGTAISVTGTASNPTINNTGVTSFTFTGGTLYGNASSSTGGVTLAPALNTQTTNKVFASPNGSSGAPTFRALAPADLPVATTSALGAVQPDGTTITINGSGVITAIGAAPSGNAGGDLASTYPNPTIATTAGGHIVTAINDGAGIISNANLTGSGEITVTGGTGLGVSGSPVALGGTVTLSNTGVTSDVAGSGISVNNGGVGAVTITNTGVLGVTAGTAISVTGTASNPTINNTGVTSFTFTGGTLYGNASSSTGGVTLAPSLNTQANHVVFAGPNSGGPLAPTFRALQPGDLPVATTSALGAVQPDGTTITINGSGIITAIGAAPSGNAGGDLASTYPNPTIATTAGGHIVTAINDGAGIISNANLTGSGEITVTGGTGLGVSGSPVALGGTVTLSNTGVTSDVAGSGISVNNGGVGAVTITNTGVLGVTAGTAISVTGTASNPTINNTGVTSFTFTGGTLYGNASSSTGGVTLAPALNTQTTNKVFASPNGSSGAPTFRALAPADLPVATTSALGAVQPDGTTITINGSGVITAIGAAPSGNAGGDLASTYPNPTIATTAGGHIVTAINDGAGIISNANLTGSGEITVTGGTGLGVSGSPVALGGTVTLSNTGVTSDVAGSGISVNNGGVGAVTITNTGVLGVTAGTAISVTGTASNPTINNTGVTSFTFTGGTLYGNASSSTGGVTLAPALNTQTTNKVFASPNGSSGAPTFRALAPADLPVATTSALGAVQPDNTTITINGSGVITAISSGGTVTNIATGTGLTGGPITTTGTISLANQASVTLLGNPTGSSAAPEAIKLGAGLAFSGTTLVATGSANNVLYDVSSPQNTAASGDDLFSVSYGSATAAPGAFINATASSGAATGLTVTATGSTQDTGINVLFTPGGNSIGMTINGTATASNNSIGLFVGNSSKPDLAEKLEGVRGDLYTGGGLSSTSGTSTYSIQIAGTNSDNTDHSGAAIGVTGNYPNGFLANSTVSGLFGKTSATTVYTVNNSNFGSFTGSFGVRGEATGNGLATRLIGVWGAADGNSGANTGSIGVEAQGQAFTDTGETNMALDLNNGEFAVGRTTDPNTQDASGVAIINPSASGYEGPSGMVTLTTSFASEAGPYNQAQSFVVGNEYCHANSIVLVTIQNDADPGKATFSAQAIPDPNFRGQFKVILTQTVLNSQTSTASPSVTIGYIIINPTR